jgi:catechol 2,3-dioxygenase-like lactoylglutathione lyase family enzyme
MPTQNPSSIFSDLSSCGETMPKIDGLLETALYVDDMPRSTAFFKEVLGLRCMLAGERITAFDAGQKGVLLLFKRGASAEDTPIAGGVLPGHDGAGPLHMAFAIPEDSYDDWRLHLTASGVEIRSEMHWPAGGRSIYFEDPDKHVLELAIPGVWPNY